jgi:NTP pyrophosphatase (non-canonical NTP hydrolase)
MELKELLEFIELERGRLRKYYPNFDTEKEWVFASAIKLSEEVGELSGEVLAHAKAQRKEKLDVREEENLSHEFADVLITTLLLARALDVDVVAALEKKIQKINKRYEDIT